MTHQAAPLTVHFRRAGGSTVALARCDGAAVSGLFYVNRRDPNLSPERQWARAFLEGVLKAPRVTGVR